jgi:hypothetical protein
MVAALHGMTVALPIFHGSDELVYQYPTILRFSRGLPFPDLHSYSAAQTPLFHVAMAYAGQLVGYQLWRLRLLQVLISYGLGLITFRLLNRRIGMDRLQALLLTLLFVLSPYVFGQSFRLMTDNLAMLFSVLALERFARFLETDRLGAFALGCAAVGGAILTRQSTAFLLVIAAACALRPGAGLSLRARAGGLAMLVLCAIPALLLFLNWHGLVPVGGDPSSCGLCDRRGASGGLSSSGLEIQTAELALATIGLYGSVLFLPVLLDSLVSRPTGREGIAAGLAVGRGAVVCATLGGLLLLAFPATPGAHAAGDIWKVAGKLPALDGSSLLFWLLVPLSGAVLWLRLRAAPRGWLAAALAAAFVISAVAIRYPWQKYVDPFALLVLLVTVRPRELAGRLRLIGVALLAVVFIIYALDLSSHRSTPAPTAAARTGLIPSASRCAARGSRGSCGTGGPPSRRRAA